MLFLSALTNIFFLILFVNGGHWNTANFYKKSESLIAFLLTIIFLQVSRIFFKLVCPFSISLTMLSMKFISLSWLDTFMLSDSSLTKDNIPLRWQTEWNITATANMPSEKIRGLGNSQTYYYLQTLLTGDTETRRKSRTFSMAEPLAVTVLKFLSHPNFLKSFFS